MSKQVSKGKAPISEKHDEFAFADVDADFFALDPELRKEIERKGYVCRFINAKQYMANFGFHRNGWRVYKKEDATGAKRGSLDFSAGADPEGYIRRGDLVLAVKPKELQDKYKNKVAHRTKLQQGFAKKAAKDLEDTARRGGIRDYEILEGYEENGD